MTNPMVLACSSTTQNEKGKKDTVKSSLQKNLSVRERELFVHKICFFLCGRGKGEEWLGGQINCLYLNFYLTFSAVSRSKGKLHPWLISNLWLLTSLKIDSGLKQKCSFAFRSSNKNDCIDEISFIALKVFQC